MGSVKDNERFGAWLNKDALYQQGSLMVPMHRWSLGQWVLGLIDPAENLKGMNPDDKQTGQPN
jgi:hypothetical protein